jgi:hypothetical protein
MPAAHTLAHILVVTDRVDAAVERESIALALHGWEKLGCGPIDLAAANTADRLAAYVQDWPSAAAVAVTDAIGELEK